jgi:Predicted integral membrane zinc-ribbon metal-binding protein
MVPPHPATVSAPHHNTAQAHAEAPRSWMDRLVDALLGEETSARYALVCRSCHTHNGLARPEEIGTLQFKCVSCGYLNIPGTSYSPSILASAGSLGPRVDLERQPAPMDACDVPAAVSSKTEDVPRSEALADGPRTLDAGTEVRADGDRDAPSATASPAKKAARATRRRK